MKRVIAAITIMALFLSLSGCYWKGKTKYQTQDALISELEDRYNELFEVRFMGASSVRAARPLVAYCSPVSNQDIIFEANLYKFGESDTYHLEDTYIPTVVGDKMQKPLESAIEEKFDDYVIFFHLSNPASGNSSDITDANKASIETYSEAVRANEGDHIAAVYIILDDESWFEDQEKIESVLSDISHDYYHLMTVIFYCYYVPDNILQEAHKIMENIEPSTTKSTRFSILVQSKYTNYTYVYWGEDSTFKLTDINII